jgi:hypothetical protein
MPESSITILGMAERKKARGSAMNPMPKKRTTAHPTVFGMIDGSAVQNAATATMLALSRKRPALLSRDGNASKRRIGTPTGEIGAGDPRIAHLITG